MAGAATLAQAQETIDGRTLDALSGNTIPFAHIATDGAKSYGSVTNIDGVYRLALGKQMDEGDSVRFSHISYRPFAISLGDLRLQTTVKLEPRSENLQEFIVKATEDPAYAMIRKAIANRSENDPEKLPFFRFTSYNKANADVARTEKTQEELENTGFRQAHFLMLESATDVIYKKPGKWNETITASKMSGMKNPMIGMVSNSFQPFSCYSNYINIAGFEYLNPISPGSANRYRFELRDSALVEGSKVYIISFRAKQNSSENLMDGSVSLADSSFALVNYRGKNTGDHALMYFDVRQAYTRAGVDLWFPDESNTTYSFTSQTDSPPIILSSTTYIKDLDLVTEPRTSDFGIADISQADGAGKLTDEVWKTIRPFELDTSEGNTYKVYDTLPRMMVNAMNWVMKQSASLASGRLNFGNVDVLMNKLMAFNQYEKFRLGLGLATSSELVKWMSAEAYFAYGFGDKTSKYGGGLRFFLHQPRDLELSVYYRSDVQEPGRAMFTKDIGFTQSGEVIRNLFTRRMNGVEQYEAALTYRPARGF